jgi:hypothetical protein
VSTSLDRPIERRSPPLSLRKIISVLISGDSSSRARSAEFLPPADRT